MDPGYETISEKSLCSKKEKIKQYVSIWSGFHYSVRIKLVLFQYLTDIYGS